MDYKASNELTDHSTDDSEPLMAREEWDGRTSTPETLSRPNRVRKGISIILLLKYIIDTILLLAIFLILLMQWKHGNLQDQLETSGDVTGFAPSIRRQITTFADNPSFTPHDPADWFKKQVRQQWLDLVPKGLGYVEIDNPEEYDNLPTPLRGFDKAVFTTSVTHQLHCLYKLEEQFSWLILNHNASLESVPEHATWWHARHCFEYLRQSILCCGDTALEGQQTTFPDINDQGSDGWDAKHICRDYSQIHRYLERKRADDRVWI